MPSPALCLGSGWIFPGSQEATLGSVRRERGVGLCLEAGETRHQVKDLPTPRTPAQLPANPQLRPENDLTTVESDG